MTKTNQITELESTLERVRNERNGLASMLVETTDQLDILKGRVTMENVINNIKYGQGDGIHTGVHFARYLADQHTENTGNRCLVRRIIDYVDKFDGREREHHSFDVVEIV